MLMPTQDVLFHLQRPQDEEIGHFHRHWKKPRLPPWPDEVFYLAFELSSLLLPVAKKKGERKEIKLSKNREKTTFIWPKRKNRHFSELDRVLKCPSNIPVTVEINGPYLRHVASGDGTVYIEIEGIIICSLT